MAEPDSYPYGPFQSNHDPIFIVTGSHKAGKKSFLSLAADNSNRSIPFKSVFEVTNSRSKKETRRIVLVKAPDCLGKRGVEHTEDVVRQRMKKISANNGRIAGMLYLHRIVDDEPVPFPFDPRTGFLGIQGDGFYRKCFVVFTTIRNGVLPNPPESRLEVQWKDKLDSGLHMFNFDQTPESARRIMDQLFAHLERWGVLPTISAVFSTAAPLSVHTEGMNTSSQTLLANNLRNDPGELPQKDLNTETYVHAAREVRRHGQHAVILLVGQSGHGKSKTINRLLGHNLLYVGKSTLGSTTKVIQRVTIPVPDSGTGVTVTVSFDDTPGDEDTTYGDRHINASLMRKYRERYFQEVHPHPVNDSSQLAVHCPIYPNVILLVAAWDSITPDAHNEPNHFTSAAGKSMFNLKVSGLVDLQRTNVIVVVTKSLSSWAQFEDYESGEEKDAQWKIEAGIRRSIILDLQRKIFSKAIEWPIVFIENGGGSNMGARYRKLPSGELSHQNLFEAICDVIAPPEQCLGDDVAGMHALRLLAGKEPLIQGSTVDIAPEILISKSRGEIPSEDSDIVEFEPPSDRIDTLAGEYLGVTYHPVDGIFGRTCVLDLRHPWDTETQRYDGQAEQFRTVKNIEQDGETTTTRLRVEFKMRDVPDLSSHRSSSTAFRSVLSEQSRQHLYLSQLVAIAKIIHSHPQLSREMLDEIAKLPGWSDESMQTYYDFFASYGTHVVTRVALGGVLRVVSQASKSSEEHSCDKILQDPVQFSTVDFVPTDVGRVAQNGTAVSQKRQVMIFRDGGGAVASQLTRVLEQKFSDLQEGSPVAQPSDYTDVCRQWIEELQKDPVFCPEDRNTEYRWLHELGGLTEKQREDLRLASESYLKVPPVEAHFVPSTRNNTELAKGSARETGFEYISRSDTDSLPREKNHLSVVVKLKVIFERARKKLPPVLSIIARRRETM